jgi:hypothetical protein
MERNSQVNNRAEGVSLLFFVYKISERVLNLQKLNKVEEKKDENY